MRTIAQLLLTFLLNASWQVALIAAFAALCDWLLRGTAARYRHFLWVSALMLSLCIPALSCARLIRPLLISKQAPTEITSAPIVVTTIISPDVEPIETPAPETRAIVEPVRRNFRISPVHVNQKLAIGLAALYALFLLYRGTNLFRAWRRTRAIISSAYEFQFLEPALTIIQRCQSSIAVSRVRILCSALVPVPITVGIVNSSIILPEHLLHEVDDELLTSAVGHELVHVARRDYLANLIYEFIFLPLSFHPAAALIRRHIKQTRELCCDESVATKLLRPEVYARSLVRLIGSAPVTRRLAADTTIGITESDNLEVRIMSLLRTPKFTPRRKTLLLIAAALLLAAPCVAATSFALAFDIDRQEPSAAPLDQAVQKLERQSQERAREELERQARELKQQMRVAPESQRAGLEAKLREVQRNLEEHERIVQQFEQQREANEKRRQELRETLAQMEKNQPANEARLKEVREKIAEMEKQVPDQEARLREVEKNIEAMQKSQTDRKVRVIYRVEPEYPPDARDKKIEGTVLLTFTVDHDGLPQNVQVKRSLYPSLDQAAIEAVRKWRFEPAIKNGQPVSMFMAVEVYFGSASPQQQAEKEKQAAERREKEERDEFQGQEFRVRLNQESERRAEREAEAKQQAELARRAKITMDQAIQIATSQSPGKVFACSLVGEHWEGQGELAKPGLVLYHVVILSGDEAKPTVTHVLVNALDGTIFRTSKEERRGEALSNTSGAGRVINGGTLNGKAIEMPNPEYPAIARAAHASGAVTVEITVDENGNVVAAHAISGHPLLQAASVSAAREAKFAPTRVNGEPVKVSGVIVYNFTAQ